MLTHSNMRLKSFEAYEKLGNDDIYQYLPMSLGNYNLLIGDAAQGKTRLFRILNWVKNQLIGQQSYTPTHFRAKFTFGVQQGEVEEEIIYELEVIPSPSGGNLNKYSEKIKRGNKELLSIDDKSNKKLWNEKKGEYIQHFYVPDNVSVIYAIQGEEFNTIGLLRNFFLRIIFFIDMFNPKNINIDQTPLILSSSGDNIGRIISEWEAEKNHLYREIIRDFKRCFEYVQSMKMVNIPFIIPSSSLPLPAIIEKDVNRETNFLEWSHGMARLLCLICLPKHEFNIDGEIYPPSMICIDEIENGLDFKTLKFIVKYLEDYSDQSQIMMSSHSPEVAELIHPKNWQVIKRKGTVIKVSKPQDIEDDLENDLNLFRQKHWMFYTKHINNSDAYEPS